MPPGQTFASQKIVFTDPLTGRTVWRMTTDGNNGCWHQAAGDQSSESISFSPDSTKIVYQKNAGPPSTKPTGVYVMDIAMGAETFIAPSPWYGAPIFSRNGAEVYWFDRSGPDVSLRAALTASPWTSRQIAAFSGYDWNSKITINSDGTLIGVAVRRASDGLWRIVVLTPAGVIHSNWGLGRAANSVDDDACQWSPVDPKLIAAYRNGIAKIWNVDSLATRPGNYTPSHSSWHPDGRHWFENAYFIDTLSGAVVMGTGIAPIHPHINPTEAALGASARLTADDRGWFTPPGRARLFLPTIAQAATGDWMQGLECLHYSTENDNSAHIHPHWSRNGAYILWTSDKGDLRDGSPPGGTGGGTDLFIVPMATADTTPPPVPSAPRLISKQFI